MRASDVPEKIRIFHHEKFLFYMQRSRNSRRDLYETATLSTFRWRGVEKPPWCLLPGTDRWIESHKRSRPHFRLWLRLSCSCSNPSARFAPLRRTYDNFPSWIHQGRWRSYHIDNQVGGLWLRWLVAYDSTELLWLQNKRDRTKNQILFGRTRVKSGTYCKCFGNCRCRTSRGLDAVNTAWSPGALNPCHNQSAIQTLY